MTREPGLYAILETTQGDIVCRLYDDDAPKTVANFVELAQGKKQWTNPATRQRTSEPLYNGTIFHRVIPGFMIQGGDPAGNGTGGPGYYFEDETKGPRQKFNRAGLLAMANSGPNTNGSQFFITVAPTDWLNGRHTIFGEVVDGQDVVVAISQVSKDRNDRPRTAVTLNSVTIEDVHETQA